MPLSAPLTFPDAVPVLTRGDVTLRAHTPADARGIVEQCVDPVSVRWTTVPHPYDLGMARGWVAGPVPAGWADGSEHAFAIEATNPGGERGFAGTVSLRDRGSRRAEIAFGAHPAVRGNGVMTTAVTLLLEYGFEELGLETVLWLANVGNLGSRRVAWKAGFTFAGTLRGWLDHRGTATDAWAGTRHRDDPAGPVGPWSVPEDAPRT